MSDPSDGPSPSEPTAGGRPTDSSQRPGRQDRSDPRQDRSGQDRSGSGQERPGSGRPERPDPGRDGLSREELARELIRERLLPVSRDDRPTTERFFPGRRPARTDFTAESHPGAGAWYEQGEMVAASEPRFDESFPDYLDDEPRAGSSPPVKT